MKVNFRIVTAMAGLALCLQATAQEADDILRFSQYNYSFGTARSTAMGGAFSSLGADLSSVVTNPAGLGMYQRSELGFSPTVTTITTKTNNHAEFGNYRTNGDRTVFSLHNIGGAFNLYKGRDALTSVTFAFTYNKMIDLNTNSYTRGEGQLSLLDAFASELEDNRNIFPDGNAILNALDHGNYVGLLGPMQAYETGLIVDDPDYGYVLNGVIDYDATTSSRMQRKQKGSVGQYDLAFGFNFSNIFYVGAGFGIQDISYRYTGNYSEAFSTTPSSNTNFRYIRKLRQDGTAWNFRFGTIIRPVEEFRIGLAIHTPTYIDISERYYSDMYATIDNSALRVSESLYFDNDYKMQTPMRFIGGLSYTFFNTAILSIDYERVWYNKMKLYWDDWMDEDEWVADQVRENYRPANNFRVGLETHLGMGWFARLGYAYYDSMYKGSWDKYGKSNHYSGGLGFRGNNWGIDFAYVYMDTKLAPEAVYWYGNEPISGISYPTSIRHNFTLTTSFRF